MARPSSIPITQTETTRLMKAARAAGFDSVSVTIHPDKRVEVQAMRGDASEKSATPLDEWRRLNGKK
jgi:hypothetical protein